MTPLFISRTASHLDFTLIYGDGTMLVDIRVDFTSRNDKITIKVDHPRAVDPLRSVVLFSASSGLQFIGHLDSGMYNIASERQRRLRKYGWNPTPSQQAEVDKLASRLKVELTDALKAKGIFL